MISSDLRLAFMHFVISERVKEPERTELLALCESDARAFHDQVYQLGFNAGVARGFSLLSKSRR